MMQAPNQHDAVKLNAKLLMKRRASATWKMPERVDVAIVGAGAAGLSAARALAERGGGEPGGIRVAVLEAAAKVGGRVAHDASLSPHAVELGPEFIHGEKENRLLDWLGAARRDLGDRLGAELVELEWPNYYYFGKEGALVRASDADEWPEVRKMHEAFEALAEMPAPVASADQSLLQYFAARGLSSRALDLADAIFANDYGADMSDVGLAETVAEQRAWRYGEKYLVLRGACLQDVMDSLAVGIDVRCGWALARLEERSGEYPYVLVSSARERIEAKCVVVTVPLAVLQRDTIAFDPPLPKPTVDAIHAVRVGNALKVALRLTRRFWPDDFYDAVCADCFMPEVWLTPAAEALGPRAQPPFIMIGFVAGARSVRVGRLPHAEIARRTLLQLDAMFGTADEPHPATSCCDDYRVVNWAEREHAHGAYTHPTLGATGARAALAAPAGDGLFFAGEATHAGVNPCIHGAMETGERAAGLAREALSRRREAARVTNIGNAGAPARRSRL